MSLAVVTTSMILSALLSVVMLIAIGGFVFFKMAKMSDDPTKFVVKVIVSVILMGMLFAFIGTDRDQGSLVIDVIAIVPFGIILGCIWAPTVAGWISRPLEAMYMDTRELEPTPQYAVAEANRKKGDYAGAIAEVTKQLELFPSDPKGTMLLAEIQAHDLKDMGAAERTVESLFSGTNLTPDVVSFVLNRLADWKLALAKDPVGAREVLERIVQLCPESEYATMALQRIAHLATPAELQAQTERPKIHLVRHEEKVGLSPDFKGIQIERKDRPENQLQELIQKLNDHPYDNEAREQIAMLYVQEFQRPDLAVEQLEQLIQQPHQLQKHVVRWLNLLADVHVKYLRDLPSATATVQTIIEMYPNTAAAKSAEVRLNYLPGELRAGDVKQAVKLGDYTKDVGLKMTSPRPWTGEDRS